MAAAWRCHQTPGALSVASTLPALSYLVKNTVCHSDLCRQECRVSEEAASQKAVAVAAWRQGTSSLNASIAAWRSAIFSICAYPRANGRCRAPQLG